ncbi:flagellar hook-basal body protein [Massilia eurypsychrophila]|jgi:flagellar hook protein FlgE|uniref:Flagellar hook protein FlgE n=1 Tax=Massilia eurypsychrophila TaxID=1485217 RepID=A0A2G8TBD7_9BURK|nr:flagellar hook protein FlgE [Massilia eurypsychrophila]PIL43351.1 flagellar hook-basal body protein [Massilia eurypsychrophila]
MSFQQGLSGLNGAAKSLDVIGNNIANASTVGFKGSQAQFADVYANSLNGAGGNQAGIGTKVSQIAQQFTQGNVESSANPLDIAINGAGFFRTTVAGATQYSRNGQFSLDKDGFMVNAQGAKLTGYATSATGGILAGSPVPIQVNTADLKPVATTRIDTQLNLDSRSLNPVKNPFDASDPNTYNKQIPIDVYDTLGNPHVMSSFYVRTDAGEWDVYVANDGTEVNSLAVASAAQGTGTVVLDDITAKRGAWRTLAADPASTPAQLRNALIAYADAAGDAVAAASSLAGGDAVQATAITTAGDDSARVQSNTPEAVDRDIAAAVSMKPEPVARLKFDSKGSLIAASAPIQVDLPIFPPTGAAAVLSVTLNFTGSSQYGAPTSEKKSSQDGYTAGTLQRFAASADGRILGQYSNGQSQALGQIVLANFANPNGLSPLGNNAWAETSASGVPLVGAPTTGSLGVLQSSAVENSNVDLTAELVNMITAQRVYQANAQTIKTQDSVLQTLVNLR